MFLVCFFVKAHKEYQIFTLRVKVIGRARKGCLVAGGGPRIGGASPIPSNIVGPAVKAAARPVRRVQRPGPCQVMIVHAVIRVHERILVESVGWSESLPPIREPKIRGPQDEECNSQCQNGHHALLNAFKVCV